VLCHHCGISVALSHWHWGTRTLTVFFPFSFYQFVFTIWETMVFSLDPRVQASPYGIATAATETPSFSSDRIPRSLAHQDIAVQIAEPEPETLEDFQLKKQFSAGVGKRLSGRPPVVSANSSRTSLLNQNGLEVLSGLTSNQSPLQAPADSDMSHSHHHHHRHHLSEKLISQVAEWIEHERKKKSNRKSRRAHHGRRKSKSPPKEGEAVAVSESASVESPEHAGARPRSYSIDSQSSEVSLDRLQRIIDDGLGALGLHSIPHYNSRMNSRRSQKKRSMNLLRAASSDTEYYDGDVLVPKCDAWLDNSKTMSYSGGGVADDTVSVSSGKEDKERKAWSTFKADIVRIAHTLRIKGWRRVPLDGGDTIEVERLSGALTNAVYVVSPPADIARTPEPGKKTPAKLLLRIYGAQVENIIDRQNELSVLRRLARKKIGPRLLGQFENGRFEEFFNATALNPESLRESYTSKKIAKRMRELHDGIELLDDEKNSGPGVFKNWDHWVQNVERIGTFLDQKILSKDAGPIKGPADAWRARGLVLGVEWPKFKATVEKYRHWLDAYYGGPQKLREQLVFAHNDVSILEIIYGG
jgi:choline kinase